MTYVIVTYFISYTNLYPTITKIILHSVNIDTAITPAEANKIYVYKATTICINNSLRICGPKYWNTPSNLTLSLKTCQPLECSKLTLNSIC